MKNGYLCADMNDTDKIAAELFGRVAQILGMTDGAMANKLMHETLVQVCHEGLAGSNLAFGNLFSQVDFLCKKHHVGMADAIAIQRMRRETNRPGRPTADDLRYNSRALAQFISAVLGVDVPREIVGRIPHTDRPHENLQPVDYRAGNRRRRLHRHHRPGRRRKGGGREPGR